MLASVLVLVALAAPPPVTAQPRPAAQGDVVVVETAARPDEASLVVDPATASRRSAGDGAGRGTPVWFFRDGDRWIALVGIDAEARPGRQLLRVEWSGDEADVLVDVKRKKFPTERLNVETKYVEPPAEVTARIVAEKERLDRLWQRNRPERLWRGAFRRPVGVMPNSAFGLQRVFNGQPRSPHNGVDFPVGAGVPVAVSNGGEVAVAEDLYFTGNTVIVDHGLGLFTTYAHLSEVLVQPGQRLEAGAIVGRVGATGRATGPHLHWGARLLSARVDPMQLLQVQTRETTDGTVGR